MEPRKEVNKIRVRQTAFLTPPPPQQIFLAQNRVSQRQVNKTSAGLLFYHYCVRAD
jgi:hypothetical protein